MSKSALTKIKAFFCSGNFVFYPRRGWRTLGNLPNNAGSTVVVVAVTSSTVEMCHYFAEVPQCGSVKRSHKLNIIETRTG